MSPRLFLGPFEKRKLKQRIKVFEQKTGCELVFHFRRKLGENPDQKNEFLFKKFKLDQTQSRRTILVTLALTDRQFAVWADQGIALHTGDKLWLGICDHLGRDLKKGKHLRALINAIEFAEKTLADLPHSQKTKDEVSNDPIIEDE